MLNSVLLKDVKINECFFSSMPGLTDPGTGKFHIKYEVFPHAENLNQTLVQLYFSLHSDQLTDEEEPAYSYESLINAFVWHENELDESNIHSVILQVIPHIKNHLSMIGTFSDLNLKAINFDAFSQEIKSKIS